MTSGSRPVANARIFIVAGPAAFRDIAALTDGRGRFELAAPVEGRYTLTCAAEGHEPVSVQVSVPTTERLHIDLGA